MTPFDLWHATGCKKEEADAFAPHISDVIDKYRIKNKAAFLAQAAYESKLFRRLEEDLFYTTPERLNAVWPSRFPKRDDGSIDRAFAAPLLRNPMALAMYVYGSRRDLGNTTDVDGWTYRGRGIFMLTGKANYTRYQQATGFEVINHPDLILDPRFACDSAGWFWKDRMLDEYNDNKRITRIVNGGEHGLAERIALTERAASLFS